MLHYSVWQELQCVKDKAFGYLASSVGGVGGGAARWSAAPGHDIYNLDVMVVDGVEVCIVVGLWFIHWLVCCSCCMN